MDVRLLHIANMLLLETAILLATPQSTKSIELLPPGPSAAAEPPTCIDEDLGLVPEVMFGEPISATLSTEHARKHLADAIARINHLNGKRRDGFMETLIANRADLRGLPFRMADACRTDAEQAKLFSTLTREVRDAVSAATWTGEAATDRLEYVWWDATQTNRKAHAEREKSNPRPGSGMDVYDRALVRAVMQILAPERASFRVGLAKFLSELPSADASRALASLAIFAPEEEVRSAAIDELRKRPAKEYTEIFLQGFQYPLPAVAQRSAHALVKLQRRDLIANLIEVLDQPDPRLPARKNVTDEAFVVRELVRVNHHRNCLLCHSPGNTPDVPEGVLTVAVPLPSEPLQAPQQYYQPKPEPNVVRIDTTYLRQDFSLMMPVPDAKPWPDRQRFDFLVRTRELTPNQAAEYEKQAAKLMRGELSPYHRAASFALRELTGRDTEPTAAAWRKLLKLAAR